MPTWIALFRGINVGGKNSLPMRDLKKLLEQLRCTDIRTYIQSGNVVFQASEGKGENLARRITAIVARDHDIDAPVIVIEPKALDKAIKANPFPDAVSNPKSLHLYFLAEKPNKPDIDALTRLKTDTESFAIKDRVLYLHTPKGFATSKLARAIERKLGVDVTARNWRTVTKVHELAQSKE